MCLKGHKNYQDDRNMVAFGKKMSQWCVPEWKDGYTDYEGLKEILKFNTQCCDSNGKKFTKPVHPLLVETKKLVESFPSHLNKAETLINFQQSLRNVGGNEIGIIEYPSFPLSCLLLNHKNLHIYEDDEFLQMLESEIQKSNDFYCDKLMFLLNKINEMIETKEFRKNKAMVKECYRGVQLLHNFRVLNFTSWVKILKKYCKTCLLSEEDITKILEFMEQTPLVCDHKLLELQLKIEEIYRQIFHPEIKTRAILLEHLRPMKKKNAKESMFMSGMFLGLIIACIFGGILIFTHKEINISVDWEIFLYPINRMICFIFLSLCMWAMALYIFRKYHICSSYILETTCGTDYLATFQVSAFTLSSLAIISLIRLLHNYFYITMGYVIFLVILLVLPFQFLYWKTKKWLIMTSLQIAISPFGPVQFRHFFLCDQFCSILPRFSMDFFLCMTYLWYQNHDHGDWVNYHACFILRPLPFLWRFLQCMRRYYFTRDNDHLVNSGKYASSVLFQLCLAFLKSFPKSELAVFSIFIGFFSMFYCLYWDFVKDWGLFRTENGLRNNIIYPKSWYYIAIVFNIILRLSWTIDFVILMIPVLEHKNFFMKYHEGRRIMLFGMLEVGRRGMWNIFRMENEVVNNAGKFRALNLPLVTVNDPDDTDSKIEISV